jgi:5'-nucleotidase
MKILVTNDDGIDAEGLSVLVDYLKAARDSQGKGHEVTVIAPDKERSGVSHAMTLKHPTKVRMLSDRVYSCSGTPADCIIVAGLGILKERPDIVVSGINRGPNLGTDIIYSGTCGAARQAALAGIPAIAVSCASYKAPLDYRASAAFVAKHLSVLRTVWKPGTFINVNGPSSQDESLTAVWAIPGRNTYYDNLKCFEGADGFTYCFLSDGRHERKPDSAADHVKVEEGYIALSLVDIHPMPAHPAEWNGMIFPNPIDSRPAYPL